MAGFLPGSKYVINQVNRVGDVALPVAIYVARSRVNWRGAAGEHVHNKCDGIANVDLAASVNVTACELDTGRRKDTVTL